MIPDEFTTEMKILFPDDGDYDVEGSHSTADHIMCDLLIELGYAEGVEIFKKARKWYA
jgi:hypothetical protein